MIWNKSHCRLSGWRFHLVSKSCTGWIFVGISNVANTAAKSNTGTPNTSAHPSPAANQVGAKRGADPAVENNQAKRVKIWLRSGGGNNRVSKVQTTSKLIIDQSERILSRHVIVRWHHLENVLSRRPDQFKEKQNEPRMARKKKLWRSPPLQNEAWQPANSTTTSGYALLKMFIVVYDCKSSLDERWHDMAFGSALYAAHPALTTGHWQWLKSESKILSGLATINTHSLTPCYFPLCIYVGRRWLHRAEELHARGQPPMRGLVCFVSSSFLLLFLFPLGSFPHLSRLYHVDCVSMLLNFLSFGGAFVCCCAGCFDANRDPPLTLRCHARPLRDCCASDPHYRQSTLKTCWSWPTRLKSLGKTC